MQRAQRRRYGCQVTPVLANAQAALARADEHVRLCRLLLEDAPDLAYCLFVAKTYAKLRELEGVAELARRALVDAQHDDRRITQAARIAEEIRTAPALSDSEREALAVSLERVTVAPPRIAPEVFRAALEQVRRNAAGRFALHAAAGELAHRIRGAAQYLAYMYDDPNAGREART